MFHSGFLVFDNVTQLDLTGPLQVLARLPDTTTHVVARSLEPVATDCGFSIVPTMTYDACPPLDLICVPGGFGVEGAMEDEATIPFLQRMAPGARFVTSVCTGAFLLGVAGLLEGRKATTHWAYHAALSIVGAQPVEARVVRDGAIITGGGVTAGIDFALTLAAEIAGVEVARAIQLGIEYDPAPPFSAGHPRVAPSTTLDSVQSRFQKRRVEFDAKLHAATERYLDPS